MLDRFYKYIKWFISIVFFMIGVYCLRIVTDTGNIKPMIIAVFSFGIVFWLSKATYEAGREIMFGSAGILILTGLLTRYVLIPLAAQMEFYAMGFYTIWAAATFVVGMPIMFYLFKKYTD